MLSRCDFDRGARSSTLDAFPARTGAGAPVDSSEEVARTSARPVASSGPSVVCDPCATGTHCDGRIRFCTCPECTDEEFVPHENQETYDALVREGAIPTYDAVHASEYGVPKAGWSA